MQTITVLGATGSVGTSTLDVLSRHKDRYSIFALTANTSVKALHELCVLHQPQYAVMLDPQSAKQLREQLAGVGCVTEVLEGIASLVEVACATEVDTVMAAIVGAAGLLPTLEAVKANKKVLLANKESLVMAGNLFKEALAAGSATLLPIDSEHNAMFQCMPCQHQSIAGSGIRKLLLTGSGGPFRQWSAEQIAVATPDQACRHPNWSMGRKISVDSASLMNKGLELIEACWLFDIEPEQVDIVIHPQSVIHSMVEFIDGSMIAQLGNPDMRIPIAHALAWPERISSGVAGLDIISQARLDFEAPAYERFPALKLAITAACEKGALPAILNAANEIAVNEFLHQRLPFGAMTDVLTATLDHIENRELPDLQSVQSVDQSARQFALSYCQKNHH